MNVDIKRLGKLLINKIRDVIPFGEGDFCGVEELFKDLEISPRQRKRAEEVLFNGEIFWDRVGNNIIIPLNGFFLIIRDVRLSIDINCQELLLKLLKDALLYRLNEIKKETLDSNDGIIPDYTKYAINQIINDGINCFLFYIEFKDLKNKIESEIFLQKIINNKKYEYTGDYRNCYFFVIYDINNYDIKYIIDRFNHISISKKNIKRIIIYPLFNRLSELDDLVLNFNYIRNITRLLQLRITSFERLFNFFNFIGIDINNNSFLLKFVSTILRIEEFIRHNKDPFYIVMINNIEIKNDIYDLKFEFQNNFFILIKKTAEKEDFWGHFNYFKEKTEDSKSFGGMVYQREPPENSLFLMELLCVFIHSKLLGEGSFVLFDSITMNVMGDEYISLGDSNSALKSYERALSANKNDTRVINSIGATLAEIGYLSRAEIFLNRGLLIDDDDPSILYNLSGINMRRNRLDMAEAMIKKAYSISPDNIPIRVRYAEVLERLGKDKEAENILMPLYIDEKNDLPLSFYKILVKILYKKGDDWRKVRDLLNIALKKNPFDEELYLMIALGYVERENDPETALLFLQKIKSHGIKNKTSISLYRKIKKLIEN